MTYPEILLMISVLGASLKVFRQALPLPRAGPWPDVRWRWGVEKTRKGG